MIAELPPADAAETGEANTIVGSFAKNAREAICVGFGVYKGRQPIFVRTSVQEIGGDALVPTKEGISLPSSTYSELIAGVRALGDVMGSDNVVARIPKNGMEEVRIGFSTYRDIPLIYIRTFLLIGKKNERSPTKKGVSMRVDLYQHLLEAREKRGVPWPGTQGVEGRAASTPLT
jgi:hypothetical protein